MKQFIEITDLSSEEIINILDRADALNVLWKENKMPQSLKGEKIALWFWGNGFRNRLAFEIGARAMGADVSFIPGELGIHEPLEDIGHYLKNWYSMLIVRSKNHQDLIKIAADANIPFINARTNYNHPCEIIGDLQYIREKRGTLEGLKIAFVGETTNLCMSWFEAAVRLPIEVIQIAPKGYECDANKVTKLNTAAKGRIRTSNDMDEINSKTDVIYTDCWPKIGEKSEVRKVFLPYQITTDTLKRMNKAGFFLPCPPVTRGEEVSEESMKSELCQDYNAKEYLLHSQNALMEYIAKN